MQISINKRPISDLISYNFVGSSTSDVFITLGLNIISTGCSITEDIGDAITIDVDVNDKFKMKTLKGSIIEKKISGTISYNKLPTILFTIQCPKSKIKLEAK